MAIIQQDFAPYLKLWDTAIDLDTDLLEWNTGSIIKQKFAEVEKKINQTYMKEAMKL